MNATGRLILMLATIGQSLATDQPANQLAPSWTWTVDLPSSMADQTDRPLHMLVDERVRVSQDHDVPVLLRGQGEQATHCHDYDEAMSANLLIYFATFRPIRRHAPGLTP